MEVERERVEAKQRKPKVFSSKVYLVTVGAQALTSSGDHETGSQSYLVRGVKTEAGAKRALLEGLTVTSKLLDSGELLDMLKAGVFPPEIVASPEAGDAGEAGSEIELIEAVGAADTVTEVEEVPGEAFHDDQHCEKNQSWEHGREFA
ncbi:hypothetical protein [Ferrovum sp.]|uniref:hypothetical protein n=1 Tax=Ferrovum sp. TaxID=2609467 RepID=UPI0026374A1D|nr:hypothetical protein [Ferrovum sp.]